MCVFSVHEECVTDPSVGQILTPLALIFHQTPHRVHLEVNRGCECTIQLTQFRHRERSAKNLGLACVWVSRPFWHHRGAIIISTSRRRNDSTALSPELTFWRDFLFIYLFCMHDPPQHICGVHRRPDASEKIYRCHLSHAVFLPDHINKWWRKWL